MKKIGFVDYYISEWHANNYPKWIESAAENLGVDYKVAYAWAEMDVSPVDGKDTDTWCAEKGIERCATITELCEKSDFIIVLAPSDPDKHLGYAEAVLKYGKRTYIDKTFAPDFATAKKIFSLGEKYGTPFFSTSALRFATELDSYKNCRQIMTLGTGSNLPEYIIHQVEMVVKKLGCGAETVSAESIGEKTRLHITYGDDRDAVMTFGPSLPFALFMMGGERDGERPLYTPVTSPYFNDLIADILRFFETGTVSFDTAETLEVMKIREGAVRAAEQIGTAVDLSVLG